MRRPFVPGWASIVVVVSVACGRVGFDIAEDAEPLVCPAFASYPPAPRRMLLVEEPTANWSDAYDACEANGGRLLVPVDAGQMQAVLEAFSDRMWLGITDAAEEGTFTAPAAPLETIYFDWLPNEPNNNGDEDCVVFYAAGFNDESCLTPRRYVCECDVIDP